MGRGVPGSLHMLLSTLVSLGREEGLGPTGPRRLPNQAAECDWVSFPGWNFGDKACATCFSITLLLRVLMEWIYFGETPCFFRGSFLLTLGLFHLLLSDQIWWLPFSAGLLSPSPHSLLTLVPSLLWFLLWKPAYPQPPLPSSSRRRMHVRAFTAAGAEDACPYSFLSLCHESAPPPPQFLAPFKAALAQVLLLEAFTSSFRLSLLWPPPLPSHIPSAESFPSLVYCHCLSLDPHLPLLRVWCGSVVWCIYIYNCYIFLVVGPFIFMSLKIHLLWSLLYLIIV